jgi:hypothetical protein
MLIFLGTPRYHIWVCGIIEVNSGIIFIFTGLTDEKVELFLFSRDQRRDYGIQANLAHRVGESE